MGISRELKSSWSTLTEEERARIVRMAWEDRTSFDAIKEQYGLGPNEVVKFMRTQLDSNSYRRWRRRAQEQGHLKHEKKRGFKAGRFKCATQRIDGSIKGLK